MGKEGGGRKFRSKRFETFHNVRLIISAQEVGSFHTWVSFSAQLGLYFKLSFSWPPVFLIEKLRPTAHVYFFNQQNVQYLLGVTILMIFEFIGKEHRTDSFSS